MAQAESKTTTDHLTIREWVEERDGKPAIVKGTDNGKGGGLLRILFDEKSGDNLDEISWIEFFKIFDQNNLEFLYQEKTKDGGESRFFKFVNKSN